MAEDDCFLTSVVDNLRSSVCFSTVTPAVSTGPYSSYLHTHINAHLLSSYFNLGTPFITFLFMFKCWERQSCAWSLLAPTWPSKTGY